MFSFLFVSLVASAQKKYETNINKAGKVDIHKGSVIIRQADTVFVNQTIVQKKKMKIYLVKYWEELDSLNFYNTYYLFQPEEDLGSFPINAAIVFDNPIVCDPNASFTSAYPGGVGSMNEECNGNQRYIAFRGQISAPAFRVHVKSRTPLKATMYGIDKPTEYP